MQPTSPQVEEIEDLYIGCILQSGAREQYVFVYDRVIDPLLQQPGDPETFVAEAEVTLAHHDWQITLWPGAYRNLYYTQPAFTTEGHNISIEPGETYRLTVKYMQKTFWAETTVPLAPSFHRIDSTLVITGENGVISWTSSDTEFSIIFDVPSKPGRRPIKRFQDFYPVIKGHILQFHTDSWDTAGIAVATIYAFNEDYKLYHTKPDRRDATSKLFSNIHGANGLFAAAAIDTMSFRYRKQR